MKIIPSLVEPSAESLFDRMEFLSSYYSHFQVDIEDGIFIENRTVQTGEVVDFILSHPHVSSRFNYDFHLMVNDPLRHLPFISRLPAKQVDVVFIHKTVFPDYKELILTYPQMRFGLVLNPNDDISSMPDTLFSALSALQIMTVFPGRQGQSFIENSLKYIEQVRTKGFGGQIYIDGGINDTTFPILYSHTPRPDILCPGSYLAKAPKEDLARRVSVFKAGSMGQIG